MVSVYGKDGHLSQFHLNPGSWLRNRHLGSKHSNIECNLVQFERLRLGIQRYKADLLKSWSRMKFLMSDNDKEKNPIAQMI